MKKVEIKRYEVVKRLIRKEINEQSAAELIGRSVRQIRRMKKCVKKEGAKGLIHGNRGQKGHHSIPDQERDYIKDLLYAHYRDFPPGLACEKLEDKHGVKRDPKTIRSIMIQEKLWRPRKNKIKLHREWRQRRSNYGELVQFDGSYHKWLEDRAKESCLLLAIDDATGELVAGEFADHEGVIPVFGFWKKYIKTHGCPHSIYLDKFSTYKMNPAFEQDNHDLKTQFERAMAELGVECITAHSPQAKGRVERAFRTLQNRLVREMRLAGINNRIEANRYLQEIFIPNFNARFAVAAKSQTNLHQPLKTRDKKRLDSIFSRHYERTIQNDYTISFRKTWFQIEKSDSLIIYKHDKVTVEEQLDGEIKLRLRGRYLDYKLLPQRPLKPIRPQRIFKERIYKPAPDNHPWKKSILFPKSKTHAK